MSAAASRVIPLPTSGQFKREAALDRDVEALIDAFRELHEVERMTGRAGLSARVRLSIAGALSAADRLAEEML